MSENHVKTGTWTQEEVRILKEYVSVHGYRKELDDILSRSEFAIRHKLYSLGIYLYINDWTESELVILKEEYPKHGSDKYMQDKLGKDRRFIRHKAAALGLTRVHWTEEQTNLIKAIYPVEGASARLLQLVQRTRTAVYGYAIGLGLKARDPGRSWTEDELTVMKEAYSGSGLTKDLRQKLNRTEEAIRKKAHQLGLKPAPRKKILGFKDVSGAWLTALQRNAKIRDIEFAIDAEYIWNLFVSQDRKCSLSGLDIVLIDKRYSPNQTASLDRIDSSKGYIKGNLQWLHRDVNMMKHNHSDNEFVRLCQAVAKHQESFPSLSI